MRKPNTYGSNNIGLLYGPNIAGPPFTIVLLSYDNLVLESGS